MNATTDFRRDEIDLKKRMKKTSKYGHSNMGREKQSYS